MSAEGMRASDLLKELDNVKRTLEWLPSPILRPHLEAAKRDLEAALIKSGITPPGRQPNDHELPAGASR